MIETVGFFYPPHLYGDTNIISWNRRVTTITLKMVIAHGTHPNYPILCPSVEHNRYVQTKDSWKENCWTCVPVATGWLRINAEIII